jgi:hypothetical protein
MRKKIVTDIAPTKFSYEVSIQVDGFTIAQGDIIKIQGEHGCKFKFSSVVTNTQTGAQWIDCFEMQRGQSGAQRSFNIDRIKRIPKKRGKRVSRRPASSAS